MGDGGSGEKSEEPTPERLRKLRKDGNVPKSQDVNSAASFLIVSVTLGLMFTRIGQSMIEFLEKSIAVAAESQGDADIPTHALLVQGLIQLGLAVAAPMAAAVISGLSLNLAQVGFLFTTKPLTPNLNKINPINGFKSMFNMKKVVELIKTIVKFILISYLSYMSLKHSIRDVVMIIRSDLFVGFKVISSIITDFVLKIGVVFLIIAAADLFYQRKRYIKDNMMTKYDIKQEYKQSEGDPHHKAERRRMHQEILHSGGGQAVKGADVVVRNPDHIAVALKYDKDKGTAPMVVAKGERLWAEKILDAAREYNVPVVRNVPLAQALNKLDVDDEIPEELYQAVAEVLTFVYALSEKQKKKVVGKPSK